jgi:HEAT repeat protein
MPRASLVAMLLVTLRPCLFRCADLCVALGACVAAVNAFLARTRRLNAGACVFIIVMTPASPFAAQDGLYQGRTVAQWMTQLQGQPSDSEKQAVVDALRHFGPRAVPAVVLMLRDSDPFARLQALWAFLVIGPAPKEALPELVRLSVKDDVADVRQMAQMVAGGWLVNVPAGDSLPALLRVLQEPDAELRRRAAYWMTLAIKARGGKIDPRLAAQVAPSLAHILREVDLDTRREVIAALGAIGPPATAAIPELRRLVREADTSRPDAAKALRSIEGR